MRTSHRRTPSRSVSIQSFEWDRALIATLRHSTLPWSDGRPLDGQVAAAAISEASRLGTRDRISLLAQFAAHQALLAFSGISDGGVAPSEWAFVARRGSDCRLLRIAARKCDPTAGAPVLTLAQQFAAIVKAPPLETLTQSSGRAEAVFVECFARLRSDAAADLRWTRRSAAGALLAPGPEGLRSLLAEPGSRWTYRDESCIQTIEHYSELTASTRVVTLRGVGLLRYSALAPLLRHVAGDERRETEIAECIAASLENERTVICIADAEAIDGASRRVLQILGSMNSVTWVAPGGDATLADTKWLVVSPRLAVARDLEERLNALPNRRVAVETFVEGPALDDWLLRETLILGEGRVNSLAEPARSFIAALALLGRTIPASVAGRLLQSFLSDLTIEELACPGVAEVVEDEFCFVSEAVREEAARLVPPASRPAVCRIAAKACEESGHLRQAALLLADAGSPDALRILEAIEWESEQEASRMLHALPPRVLGSSARLLDILCRALTNSARYRDARVVAQLMAPAAADVALARIERRTGLYAAALARLDRVTTSCETDLLRAEILVVLRRDDEALALLEDTTATTDGERRQLAYMRALLSDDADGRAARESSDLGTYLDSRLRTYRALNASAFDDALDAAESAATHAATIAQRIDALLDRVYTFFTAGRWPEARQAALEALTEVDETQGDRAAGGLLFLLAYLCADDGQWEQAAHRIERLRHFYAAASDDRHLGEIDLLEAHLQFARGRFEEARRAAASLLERELDAPVRAAALAIALESDWVEGRPGSAPSVHIDNVELRDRWALYNNRAGYAHEEVAGVFNGALLAWEERGGPPPRALTRSDELKIFRSALARGRRGDPELLRMALDIAGRFGIEVDTMPDRAEVDVRFLRAAAVRDFPFSSSAFEAPWWFATRNRLGHWNVVGHLPVDTIRDGNAGAGAIPDNDRLDRIAASGEQDWVACSDRELLWVDGISAWPADSRDALAALFRRSAELHRLRRAREQEELADRSPRSPAPAGIIGEAPALRDVLGRVALIARRDVPVCILGESGVGKELVARAVHAASPRKAKPFVALNCSALPENLIESELFGHVRGAFTGAERDRAGLVEAADGGTLFLDEIGDMPVSAQAKLLRFLQEGEFRRVGDGGTRRADVRIVTATNRKLEAAVESGSFRADLYYRIRGVELLLPPLRERGSDILLLARHFLVSEREKHRTGPLTLSPDVEAIFLSHRWPGNVRELQNAVRGAHAMAGEARQLEVDHLPPYLRAVIPSRIAAGSYQEAVARFRRDLIEKALAETGGNQNRAAAVLNMSRQALGYQIRELGILTRTARRTSRV